jgi:hypothetical protein
LFPTFRVAYKITFPLLASKILPDSAPKLAFIVEFKLITYFSFFSSYYIILRFNTEAVYALGSLGLL